MAETLNDDIKTLYNNFDYRSDCLNTCSICMKVKDYKTNFNNYEDICDQCYNLDLRRCCECEDLYKYKYTDHDNYCPKCIDLRPIYKRCKTCKKYHDVKLFMNTIKKILNDCKMCRDKQYEDMKKQCEYEYSKNKYNIVDSANCAECARLQKQWPPKCCGDHN